MKDQTCGNLWIPEVKTFFNFFYFLVFTSRSANYFEKYSDCLRISAVAAGGGQGSRTSLTAACAPHFDLLKILFLEHH